MAWLTTLVLTNACVSDGTHPDHRNPVTLQHSFGKEICNESDTWFIMWVMPKLPRDGSWDGMKGFVELGNSVDEAGNVRNVTIRTSEPSGIFDEWAISSINESVFCEPRGPLNDSRTRMNFDFGE